MLKLRSQPSTPASPPSPSRVPGTVRLAVAWLHGELAMVAGGAAWVAPQPVPDVIALGEALREGVARTQFTGRTISLALAHPRVVPRRLEMPPLRGVMRRRYLQRQADQSPSHEGPAHWVCRPAMPSTAAEAVVMNLMPRRLYDDVVAACRKAGLDLTLLVPFSELLLGALPLGAATADETALLASAWSGVVEMVVIQGDGVPLLARSASDDRAGDGTRLAGDLNRTLQFVQQNFSRPPGTVWWLGAPITADSPSSRSLLSMGVQFAPGEFAALDWARRTAQLSAACPGNLVTREQQEASGRRVLGSVHQILSAVSLVAATIFCLYAETMRHRENAAARRLELELTRGEERDRIMQAEVGLVRDRRAFLGVVGSEPLPPLPLWFLGYLGEAAPGVLRLTNVVVQVRDEGWQFRIAGVGRSNRETFHFGLGQLSNALTGDPFVAQWIPAHGEGRASETPASWAARLRDPKTDRSAADQHFSLEGRLR